MSKYYFFENFLKKLPQTLYIICLAYISHGNLQVRAFSRDQNTKHIPGTVEPSVDFIQSPTS